MRYLQLSVDLPDQFLSQVQLVPVRAHLGLLKVPLILLQVECMLLGFLFKRIFFQLLFLGALGHCDGNLKVLFDLGYIDLRLLNELFVQRFLFLDLVGVVERIGVEILLLLKFQLIHLNLIGDFEVLELKLLIEDLASGGSQSIGLVFVLVATVGNVLD